MTTFDDGLFQYGGTPIGSGMLPLMGGAGKAIFVDPALGSAGNTGLSPDKALVSVGAAYALATDKSGDTIYFLNDGNTSGSSRESTIPLVWAKDNVHLVGLCAPAVVSQRSRITPVSTAALTAAPVIDVTGNGNIFKNVQIAHFGADTNGIGTQGLSVSGSRNYFENVHVVGVVNAHTGDEATGVDLLVDGGSENVFKHCAFGVDTVVRSTTNAVVEFTTAATRNLFEDCYFAMVTDAATPLFIKADGSGDLDRWTIFKNCTFINAVESGATSLTAAINQHNSSGGMILLQDSEIIGATDVAAADNGNVFVNGIRAATTSGLGLAVTR